MVIKLRHSLIKNILISTLSSFVLLFIIFNILFNYNFINYLKDVRSNRFDELRSQISIILQTQDFDSIASNIGVFAYTEGVQIKVYDDTNKLLATYNPLGQTQEKVVTNTYDIIRESTKLGTMEISYLEDNSINKFAQDFKNDLTLVLMALCFIAVIIATSSSYILSIQTTRDIEKISQLAKDYKNKEYDSELKVASDIFELKDLSKDMAYLGQALKQQEEIRNKYSQNISHELRTPLTNLLLYTEAITDGVVEVDKTTIESIQEEIFRMNSLVDKLRQGFNEDISISDIRIESYNLSDKLRSISTNIAPSIKANDIKFSISIKEDVWVSSDKEKITQIIYNLLSNAIKACRDGDKIELLMKENKGLISISIIDTGIGIAEEDIKKIFDRNFRVNNQLNKEISGSGIGLSLVDELVKAIGGTIEVESKIGRGSKFTIHFPSKL